MSDAMSADRQAVVEVATRYFVSWFEGDVEGMRAVLHPQLAKRTSDPRGGELALDEDTADQMVGWVARGARPVEEHGQEVTVLDISNDIASVKVVSKSFTEYLHLGRFGDRWLIVNALYEPSGGADLAD